MSNSRGNAFLYILLAIVLLAGLTFAISKSGSDIDAGAELGEGQAKIAANAVIAYAAAAQNAVLRLQQVGVDEGAIDLLRPDKAGFNSGDTTVRLYHPDGGGLTLKPMSPGAGDSAAAYTPGFYIGRFSNFYWTPTAAEDVIFAAYGLKKEVCEEINRQITGNVTIPSTTQSLKSLFVDVQISGSGTNASAITTAECSGCEEKPALCVTDGSNYAYYNVLVAR